jgi:hypothetical protein
LKKGGTQNKTQRFTGVSNNWTLAAEDESVRSTLSGGDGCGPADDSGRWADGEIRVDTPGLRGNGYLDVLEGVE